MGVNVQVLNVDRFVHLYESAAGVAEECPQITFQLRVELPGPGPVITSVAADAEPRGYEIVIARCKESVIVTCGVPPLTAYVKANVLPLRFLINCTLFPYPEALVSPEPFTVVPSFKNSVQSLAAVGPNSRRANVPSSV